MKAIAAIGGTGLLPAAKAFRGLVPCAIWVLGLKTPRDPSDQLVRSLDALIEPLMQPYFAAESQGFVATISAQLTTHLLPTRSIEPQGVNAVSATLSEEIAGVLALIAMLDKAHALDPIVLALDDDSGPLARTAVAWARARGVPSVTLPVRVPLRRPRKPCADRTIVVSQRSRRAYRAADIADPLLVDVSRRSIPYDASAAERSGSRAAAKAAVTRALNWLESDPVIVFEPAQMSRESALEPTDGFAASLAAIFSAFAVARASVPNFRLAIVCPPTPDGHLKAGRAAAAVGFSGADFIYSEADFAVWMAAADIAVSADSVRSIDAAVAGVPALNLWRAANWYLGPAFAAEDGVLDVSPDALGPTLIALAGNPDLRTHIASLAGPRIAPESTTEQGVSASIAGELAKLRRRETLVAPVITPKPDIVIYAPDYSPASAGIRALYRLCHLINLAGGNASMYPPTRLHPEWNTPRRDTDLTDRTIVIYPEIYHPVLPVKRVVRWVLNEPGLLAGPKAYSSDEMVFYFEKAYRTSAQAATTEILTDERELQVAVIEPELFYDDRSLPRLYDCVFVHKGRVRYNISQPMAIRDAYEIRTDWPATRAQTAALLRGCRRLYSFDSRSAIISEGIICGVQVFVVYGDNFAEVRHDLSDYARQYYDLSPVRRFLRLIEERWN